MSRAAVAAGGSPARAKTAETQACNAQPACSKRATMACRNHAGSHLFKSAGLAARPPPAHAEQPELARLIPVRRSAVATVPLEPKENPLCIPSRPRDTSPASPADRGGCPNAVTTLGISAARGPNRERPHGSTCTGQNPFFFKRWRPCPGQDCPGQPASPAAIKATRWPMPARHKAASVRGVLVHRVLRGLLASSAASPFWSLPKERFHSIERFVYFLFRDAERQPQMPLAGRPERRPPVLLRPSLP